MRDAYLETITARAEVNAFIASLEREHQRRKVRKDRRHALATLAVFCVLGLATYEICKAMEDGVWRLGLMEKWFSQAVVMVVPVAALLLLFASTLPWRVR